MANLFERAACFTDIHYGLKQNSRQHLIDCDNYVTWFIEEAKARNCETCIFLGDWHHHRASINIATMNSTIKDLKRLNDAFETVYFITGNHDLFYREKRDLNSIEFARDLSNFVMVDEHFLQDGVAIIPWLVGDEHKQVAKMKCKYMFGHFELPYFKMNAMIEMPDHGGIRADMLSGPEYVFSGHFHKRQYKNNIHYIGNAFPHNYADAQDNERGAMFLEWDGEPVYVNWPECPKYVTMGLRQLLEAPEQYLDAQTHARVKLDVNISYEEANFIRETFAEKFNVREIQLLPVKEEEEAFEGGEIQFESVDQIVIQQLETIESNLVDTDELVKIYRSLETL
ncbi:metallophosphoesterase [bacterium]|jgi:DNA repair exonuclease SbcCD nuclease subunit|nr:metallophosphoesterase [Hellea sp.]MDA7807180.1 metallophosphoesterase [bacterium]MDA9048009.1 metallophosphoesterase [Hellea sp.]MDA9225103.1 metallophosphoesterase [bacterium]